MQISADLMQNLVGLGWGVKWIKEITQANRGVRGGGWGWLESKDLIFETYSYFYLKYNIAKTKYKGSKNMLS